MENLDKIAAIADLFPGCVTEIKSEDGRTRQAIDFDLLKQALSGHIVQEGQERYQFTWPGKKQAMAQADTPTDMTLLPCREESVDFNSTQNLYIEGDNLEVLKLLRKDYAGRIKMIYIDPPYNTGCKFIYKDRFTRSAQDYLRSTGQTDAQGNFLVEDPETEGRFHTADHIHRRHPLGGGLLVVNKALHEVLLPEDLVADHSGIGMRAPVKMQAENARLLQQQEGVEGRDGRARVPQQYGADVGDEGGRPHGVGEGHPVVAGVGLGDGCVFARGLPVEFAGIHDDAA